MYKYNFSIASIFKDESEYLEEWLTYHRLIGCEHFFLANNTSIKSIHSEKTIRILIDQVNKYHDITWFPFFSDSPQFDSYQKLLNMGRGITKWMGFIDIDEFIHIEKFRKIKPILDKIEVMGEEVAALAIHWCIFGSSGKEDHSGLVLENFFQRAKKDYNAHRTIKCIVQPDKCIASGGAHWFTYKKDHWAINELGQRMPEGGIVHKGWKPQTSTMKSIRINHYCVKSKRAYKEKVARGFVDKKVHEISKQRWKSYFREMDQNEIRDDTMKYFLPELKKILGLK